MAKGTAKLGFYSRKSAVANIDRRSSEAKLMQRVVTNLIDECGGEDKVRYSDRLVIEATADICLRLQIAMGHAPIDSDVRENDKHVVHMIGALRKNLTFLRIEAPQAMGPTLAEYLSAKQAERVG